jgi:hypothetical protein
LASRKVTTVKVGADFVSAKRDLFVAAALNEQGESRVDAAKVREAIEVAVAAGNWSLRTFNSGSVGVRVALKISVENEEGGEFDLTGSVLLTVPETVVKSK